MRSRKDVMHHSAPPPCRPTTAMIGAAAASASFAAYLPHITCGDGDGGFFASRRDDASKNVRTCMYAHAVRTSLVCSLAKKMRSTALFATFTLPHFSSNDLFQKAKRYGQYIHHERTHYPSQRRHRHRSVVSATIAGPVACSGRRHGRRIFRIFWNVGRRRRWRFNDDHRDGGRRYYRHRGRQPHQPAVPAASHTLVAVHLQSRLVDRPDHRQQRWHRSAPASSSSCHDGTESAHADDNYCCCRGILNPLPRP